MLLVVCTLLPDLGSLLGVPDFDIPVFCCQLVGIVLGGIALFSFYQAMGNSLSVPFWFWRGAVCLSLYCH